VPGMSGTRQVVGPTVDDPEIFTVQFAGELGLGNSKGSNSLGLAGCEGSGALGLSEAREERGATRGWRPRGAG